eukprot:gene20214-32932_t
MKRVGRPLRECDSRTLTGRPSFASSSSIFDVQPHPRMEMLPVSSAYLTTLPPAESKQSSFALATGFALSLPPGRISKSRSFKSGTTAKTAAARSAAWSAMRGKRASKRMDVKEETAARKVGKRRSMSFRSAADVEDAQSTKQASTLRTIVSDPYAANGRMFRASTTGLLGYSTHMAIDPSNLTPSMKRQWHQGQAHKNDTATASTASGISVGPNDYGPVIELVKKPWNRDPHYRQHEGCLACAEAKCAAMVGNPSMDMEYEDLIEVHKEHTIDAVGKVYETDGPATKQFARRLAAGTIN